MLSGETVRIKVGKADEQKSFILHKGILSFYSGYFKSALNSEFIEGQTDEIDLPEEDVQTFRHFIFWLYRGTLRRSITTRTILKMSRLWVFGDRRNIPLLQNSVLDEMRDIIKNATKQWLLPGVMELSFVYNNTTPDSALRRFIVDVAHRTMSPTTVRPPSIDHPQWNAEALQDMLAAALTGWEKGTAKSISKADVEGWDMCSYHVHEEGIRCPKASS